MKSIHASGFHGSPDEQVAAQIAAYIAQHAPDYLSHTEANPHRGALGADGYGVAHKSGPDGQSECALTYRLDGPDILTWETLLLSERTIPRRGQRGRALVVKFADHTRIVVHLPSGVEGLTGLRNNEQAVVWRESVATLAAYVKSLSGPVVIVGDWNVSLRRRWVRRYLRSHFPGFTFSRLPRVGATHGLRFIDFSLYRGLTPAATSRVLRNSASDHRAILEETTVPATPKTDALVAALRRRGVEVLTHDQWGSVHADTYRARLISHPHGLLPGKPVDTLWNHITVTNDDGPLAGDFKADMREVERIGMQRFGSGFSYNFGVDRNATKPRVAIGQLLEAKGTHTVNDKGVAGYSFNQNKVALAVAWVGIPGDKLNEHALTAMVQLRAALIEVGAMTTTYDDVPHSLVAFKDCPTGELRDRLRELRILGLAAVKRTETLPPTRMSRVRIELEAIAKAREAKHPIQARAIRSALKLLPRR